MRESKATWRRLTDTDRTEIRRRVAAGEAFTSTADALGCSTRTVYRLFRKPVPKRATRPRASLRLSLAEREEISRAVEGTDSCRSIAARLGRAPSTVARDIAANGGRSNYRAWRADVRAVKFSQRPKVPKLAGNPGLRHEVERRLEMRWSPQQIAARLVLDYPENPEMRVSHETIYQSLFVQARGALRGELTRCLRSGRTLRRARKNSASRRGHIAGMVLISDRPARANRPVSTVDSETRTRPRHSS
ncbi:MAG: IS30 family transposase [Hyphomicrobiaceae bacterium]|jgi:IS30 family transposase